MPPTIGSIKQSNTPMPPQLDRFRRRRRRFISMLNITTENVSDAYRGFPGTRVFDAQASPLRMWSRFVPGTTKCLHPNREHGQ